MHATEEFCPDTRLGRMRPEANGIRIVDQAAEPLQAGDVALQLNGRVLRTCEDMATEVDRTLNEGLQALFLVRRGDETVPVLVDLEKERVPDTPTPLLPTVVPSPSPMAELDPAHVTEVRAELAELASFGRGLTRQLPLPASQSLIRRLEGVTEKHRRKIASDPALGIIEPILGYFETAGAILSYKREEATQQNRTVRQLPPVLPYQSASVVATWLTRYPFLQASVREAPHNLRLLLTAERAGYWSPDDAIGLLLEQAVSEAEALSARLAAEP